MSYTFNSILITSTIISNGMKKSMMPVTSRVKNIVNTLLLGIISLSAQAQDDSVFKPSGKLWGLAYGDIAYKSNADSLNRGGVNQYTGIKQGESIFQFRRIYLGYDYAISRRFSAEFLLAAEDNETSSALATPVTSGDLLVDSKLAMSVKLANIKWKNIFRGSDLTLGQSYTPAAVLTSEVVWDYRCIERTVSDIRRTPTYDMGAKLSGTIYNTPGTEVGYSLMAGNGTLAKPENDPFKWFYGDVYAKLLSKRIIIDLYADYTKINWTAYWHHDRSMLKGMIAYTAPKFTVGVEAFMNSIMNDDIVTTKTGLDTITNKAMAISVFARGRIYRDILGFFVRYDNYNPSGNNTNSLYTKDAPITATYDPNTKEQFFTAGIDYSPISKIHIMPNVWYNEYDNAGPQNLRNGYDLVYRLSLYYVYGK